MLIKIMASATLGFILWYLMLPHHMWSMWLRLNWYNKKAVDIGKSIPSAF
ncbi:hypothetical protein [Bacillus cereus]|nr:hypothetical protein [Bacillus cereus]WJX05664.1 hypothetical protein QTA68_01950 [Bacillus cereus]